MQDAIGFIIGYPGLRKIKLAGMVRFNHDEKGLATLQTRPFSIPLQ